MVSRGCRGSPGAGAALSCLWPCVGAAAVPGAAPEPGTAAEPGIYGTALRAGGGPGVKLSLS